MFENKTITRLEKMLDDALDGTFVESNYDESKLSRLESRWKDFLGNSVLSNSNLEAERKRLERFISDLSHQTKTPMTNIKMYSELLREEAELGNDASIEKIKKYANEISKQNTRLEFLIDSLTKLSRLENGTLAVVTKVEEIDKLISTSIAAVDVKAKSKNIKINHKKEAGMKAAFDLKWTNEALINILDNAVKYTPEDGNIEVFSQKFEIYSAIHVVDDGPGISEEDMAKIFGRFYRGSEFQQEEGVGIGLYLAREIIAKEDGYIKVIPNNKRSGGEFIIYLRNTPE
ncbi:MAG: HAMP domain-containing histidine kinase [Eubacterium sp.]|nr:HAMP domain-containing histidine kinase [Eubacterium sp.]